MASKAHANAGSTNQREVNSLNTKIGKIQKDLSRLEAKNAGLAGDLDKMSERADIYKAKAERVEGVKNEIERELSDLKKESKMTDPIGKGAFAVRTKVEQLIMGTQRPAGTLIGYITGIEGFDSAMIVDAMYYGSAVAVKSDVHEVFEELESSTNESLEAVNKHQAAELNRKQELIEKAAAEIEKQDSEITAAKGLLEEAAAISESLVEENATLKARLVEAGEQDDDEENENEKSD